MTPEVFFLDVNQGHAAVLAEGNSACVVDCPRRGVDSVISALDQANAGGVAAIFITHRDLDHCGGIPLLLDLIDVETLYLNYAWALPVESDAKTRVKSVLSSIFSLAERDAVRIEHVYAGATGDIGDMHWTVLAPTVYEAGRASLTDATNRASMVIFLIVASKGFLVLGDADHVTLRAILADSSLDIKAEVLLASHHGAQLANLDELLGRVRPTYAVISVGRGNAYGHPHASTLTSLASQPDCRVMCTQVNALCHSDPVDAPACAGSIHFWVEDGFLRVAPDIPTHLAVIARWSSPRCI